MMRSSKIERFHGVERSQLVAGAIILSLLFVGACSPNPQPAGLTAIPTLAPRATITLAPALPQAAPTAGAPSGSPTAETRPESPTASASSASPTAGTPSGSPTTGAPSASATAGTPSGSPTVSSPSSSPVAEASGAVGLVNYQLFCVCHGNQGQGSAAPALRGSKIVQAMADQALFTTIAEGLAGTKMPAWALPRGGPWSDAEIRDVAAYVRVLQGLEPVAQAPQAGTTPTATLPVSPTVALSGTPSISPTAASTPSASPSGTLSISPTTSPTGTLSAATTAAPTAVASPTQPTTATTGTVPSAGDATRGQLAFGIYCAYCHGPQGVQGFPNPGSADGIVPPLVPMAEDVINPDASIFAANVRQFVEQGSVPEGPSPWLLMAPYGDQKLLTQQQIADLVAYIIQQNKAP